MPPAYAIYDTGERLDYLRTRTHTHTCTRTHVHTHSTQPYIVPQTQVLNQDTDEDLPIFDVQFFYFDLSPLLLHTKIYGIAAVYV